MLKKDKKIRIYSALEVANICGVVNQTAINWIKNSHLKAFTTPGGQYRVYSEDLYHFLKERGMRIPDGLAIHEDKNQEKTLLIIDDDEDLNNLIRDYVLRKADQLTVLQAFDGFEAGKMIAEHKPSLVILDIGLPGVDGFKLCRALKSDPDLRATRIISISGFNNPQDEKKILAEGADLFISKPLDFPKLVTAVNTLLED